MNEIKIINEIIDIVKKDKNRLMFYSDYIFLSALLNKDLNTPTRWPSLNDASNPSKKNEFQFYTYQEDIDRIAFEGGLFVFKVHPQYQCTEENIAVVEDVIRELKNKNKCWV